MAFRAVCTRQGCVVSEVKDGTINCTCHGSKFQVSDGSVASGPGKSQLATKTVAAQGELLILG